MEAFVARDFKIHIEPKSSIAEDYFKQLEDRLHKHTREAVATRRFATGGIVPPLSFKPLVGEFIGHGQIDPRSRDQLRKWMGLPANSVDYVSPPKPQQERKENTVATFENGVEINGQRIIGAKLLGMMRLQESGPAIVTVELKAHMVATHSPKPRDPRRAMG